MESNILDELLNKIKSLEEKNSLLKANISEVKSMLDTKPQRKISIEDQVNLEDEMLIDDDSSNSKKYSESLTKESTLANLKEMRITYIPYEQYNSLWIMGDFTDWEPRPMNKNKDIFSYTAVLVKGFKYYFSFTAKDQIVIDFNQDYENNSRSNQVNNYIELKLENTINDMNDKNNSQSPFSKLTPFDYKTNSKLLQEGRKELSKAKMADKREVALLEDLIDFSDMYKTRVNYLTNKREETIFKLKKYYESKTEKIKRSEINNFSTLCEVFKNRIVERNNTLYYINSIDLNDNSIKVMKIYDENGIKINLDYYIKKGIFISFKFSELDKNFKILSQEVSINILKEHEMSTSVLKIFYKLESAESIQSEGFVYIRGYGKRLTIESSQPDLDLSKYEIDTSANMINEIKNKTDNLKVIFLSEEVKDLTEALPISLQIYYSYYKKTVNLLHLHKLNETLQFDNNSIDIINLSKTDDVRVYKNFTGSSNKRLRILFKNYKINKIFYFEEENKVIELKAEEFNFKLDRIVKIKCDGYLNNFFAKIKKVPIYALAKESNKDISSSSSNNNNLNENMDETNENDYTVQNEKIEVCQIGFDNDYLSGYIDLQVIFDCDEKYLDTPIDIALPSCFLIFLPVMKEMDLEKIAIVEINKRKSQEIVSFNNLFEDVMGNYNKFQSDKETLRALTKEELKKLTITLEGYKTILPKIGMHIEQNELWTYLEKLCLIESTIHSLLSIFNEMLSSL